MNLESAKESLEQIVKDQAWLLLERREKFSSIAINIREDSYPHEYQAWLAGGKKDVMGCKLNWVLMEPQGVMDE